MLDGRRVLADEAGARFRLLEWQRSHDERVRSWDCGDTLVFQVVVNDGFGGQASDTVTIAVLNANTPPAVAAAAMLAFPAPRPDNEGGAGVMRVNSF